MFDSFERRTIEAVNKFHDVLVFSIYNCLQCIKLQSLIFFQVGKDKSVGGRARSRRTNDTIQWYC
jgi:hypothetical protein